MNKLDFKEAISVFNEVLENSNSSTDKIWAREKDLHLYSHTRLLMNANYDPNALDYISDFYSDFKPEEDCYFVFYSVGTYMGKTVCAFLADQFNLDDEEDMEGNDKLIKECQLVFCTSEQRGEVEMVYSKLKWFFLKKFQQSQLSNLDYMI